MRKCRYFVRKSMAMLLASTLLVGSVQTVVSHNTITADAATKKVKKIKLSTSTGVKTVYIGGASKYKSLKITAAVTPKGASKKVTFTSSKPKVATVNSKGKVTGKKVGTTTITVKSVSNSSVKKTIKIQVKKYAKRIRPKSLSANISKTILSSGKTAKITATIKPATTTNKTLKYKSYNKNLATVSNKGIVTANTNGKAGKVKIRVYTADKNKKNKTLYKDFFVTIQPVNATSVTCSTARTIYTGVSSKLTGTITPTITTNKALTYTSSNSSIVTVDKNGNICGKRSGIANVTVKTANGKTAVCKVTVRHRRISIHDPSVTIDNDGTYYLFGTHLGAAKSTDLMNWTDIGGTSRLFGVSESQFASELNNIYTWMNTTDSKDHTYTWAPSVIYNKTTKKYYYYACTSVFGTTNSVIWFATADSIEGPYSNVTPIVYSGFNNSTSGSYSYTRTNIQSLIKDGTLNGLGNWFRNGNYNSSTGAMPNAIDPAMFYDEDGRMWMTYGSFSGGIYILEIDTTTGMPIYPASDDSANNIVSYFGKKLTTSTGSDGNGEGPYIIYDKASDYYYLYITYGGLAALDGYNTRVFRSKNPDGPYEDAAGTAGTSGVNKGLKLFGNYKLPETEAYLSPGHSSAAVDAKGNIFHFYHTRFNDGVGNGHQVRVHQMYVNSQGWTVALPYEYNGETLPTTGYSVDEIVGTYKFINHGNTTLTTDSFSTASSIMGTVQTISLNADGTINGDVVGTWSLDNDNSPNVTLNIGGIYYYGMFCYQTDESDERTMTMTFSASGSNNCTVWGSKYDLTDAPIVARTATQLNTLMASAIRTNLPTTGFGSSTITWTSDNTSVISNSGVVTRPSVDTAVSVTAVITYGTATRTTTYTANVKARPQTTVNDDGVIANYVHLPADITEVENFTFSAWVYSTSDSWWQRIVDLGDGEQDSIFITNRGGSGVLRLDVTKGSDTLALDDTTMLEMNKWNHIAMTMSENGSASLYLNGELVGSYPAGTIKYLLNDFEGTANYLGKSQYSVDAYFKGYMDDVTFYGKTLSATEISDIYNN